MKSAEQTFNSPQGPRQAGIRWGTSSWTYEGWQGLVYRDVASYGSRFKRDSLQEYAADPRFDCVGVDSSFYRPLSLATATHYAKQLPDGFGTVLKCWQSITAPVFTRHFGPSDRARRVGEANPLFLDPDVFRTEVAAPLTEALGQHVNAVVLEFPLVAPKALGASEWLVLLDRFLGATQGSVPIAVEVRSAWWLSDAYFEVLAAHGAAHAFNVWTRMPLPHVVLQKFPQAIRTAPHSVCRALVAPGTAYADAVKRFAPYNELQQVRPDIRRSILRLVQTALREGIELSVLINNRLEGCGPETIAALRADLESGAWEDGPPDEGLPDEGPIGEGPRG